MREVWWLSSKAMTVQIEVDENGTVVHGAPVVRRFVGSPAIRLHRWMEKQGDFQARRLARYDERRRS